MKTGVQANSSAWRTAESQYWRAQEPTSRDRGSSSVCYLRETRGSFKRAAWRIVRVSVYRIRHFLRWISNLWCTCVLSRPVRKIFSQIRRRVPRLLAGFDDPRVHSPDRKLAERRETVISGGNMVRDIFRSFFFFSFSSFSSPLTASDWINSFVPQWQEAQCVHKYREASVELSRGLRRHYDARRAASSDRGGNCSTEASDDIGNRDRYRRINLKFQLKTSSL